MALAEGIGAIVGALTARSAGGSIVIGGIDILANLQSQAVTSFAYTDNTSDQADDLSVQIADPMRTWMSSFLPKKGVECMAQIKVKNWTLPGDTRMVDCGVFWLDQIDFTGPPNTVSVKATSVPVITGVKTQKKYQSWENVPLQDVLSEIATDNGLTLVWDATDNPNLERVDQADTPDLEFVRDLAKDNSLSIKIYKRQLVVYSEKEYEARPAVYVLPYGVSHVLNYSFSSKLNDTYKKGKNAYTDPDSGEVIETEFEPDESPEGTGSELELNESVQGKDDDGGGSSGRESRDAGDINFNSSDADAEAASLRIVKSKMREKNKREYSCTMSLVGNPDYISGLNVEMIGWGVFDGKWFISSSNHAITSSGYVTELTMRKALTGY